MLIINLMTRVLHEVPAVPGDFLWEQNLLWNRIQVLTLSNIDSMRESRKVVKYSPPPQSEIHTCLLSSGEQQQSVGISLSSILPFLLWQAISLSWPIASYSPSYPSYSPPTPTTPPPPPATPPPTPATFLIPLLELNTKRNLDTAA